MAIQIKCETCGNVSFASSEFAGQTMECSKCQGLVAVPEISNLDKTEGPPTRVVVVNNTPLKVVTQSDRAHPAVQSVVVTSFDVPFGNIWKLVSQIWLVFFIWTLCIAVIGFVIGMIAGRF